MTDRIQSWLDRVPGYTGYRDKERRRDEDKRVRVEAANAIDAIAARIQDAGRTLANARQMQDIQAVESLYQRVSLLGNKVRNATYGYAGLFDDVKIDEAALDQLGRFDRQMGKELGTLDQAASAVQAAGSDPGAIEKAIGRANGEMDRLETLWDTRSSVIASGQPTSDQKALALLDEPAQPAPRSAASRVRPGVALSILGDNFIVEVTMEVAGDDETLSLARIGEGDWLLQATGATVATARLHEGQAAGQAAPDQSGRLTIMRKDGSAQQAAVAYALDVAGDTVTVRIDFGDETRAYTGNKIAPNDVEIYGQPAQ